MNSWPNLYLPPLPGSINIPNLRMQTTYGLREFEGSARIRMYVCGITPYDATHLGHAATYLTFDCINRYLSAQGRTVQFVENITDIDEPLLERADRDDIDWRDLAKDQIDLYQSDMTALRVIPPQNFVPATVVMDLVSEAISAMQRNGFAYQLDNDLYFDISSFLDQLPLPYEEALGFFAQRGGDPQRSGKRNPLDPILWLANRPGEPGWNSVHGFGRPGWHIECAVIALRYLTGPDFLASSTEPFSIDIQGGGSDLIFPHHFMSAAQSAAITGSSFSYSYIHTGMIGLDGEKMSKSKGNLVFVSKLLSQGIDPMIIRYALLNTHYSTDRMWTSDLLSQATSDIALIRSALSREDVADTSSVLQKIVDSLADNLNTPAALAEIRAWADRTRSGETGGSAGELSRGLDLLLGLAL